MSIMHISTSDCSRLFDAWIAPSGMPAAMTPLLHHSSQIASNM